MYFSGSYQNIIITHHQQELHCSIEQDQELKRLICHFSCKDQDLYALVAAFDQQPEFLIKRIISFAKAYIRIHNVEKLELDLQHCLNNPANNQIII
ncbi:MAG: hypothetical protein RLZZ422_2569 [Pseudomonadota bacterium]|jgi:hypothetical protein